MDKARTTEATEATEAIEATDEAATKSGGYSYRIPIRMTREERATIGRKAQECNLSVSRYLVEAATAETGLCPEDKARLRRLQAYFDEATTRLRGLSALPVFRGPTSEEMQRTARLRETLCVLESLSTEISRRLP